MSADLNSPLKITTAKTSMQGNIQFLPIRSVYYRKQRLTKLDPLQLQTQSTESTMPTSILPIIFTTNMTIITSN